MPPGQAPGPELSSATGRRALVVVGMHRTGTSAITRVLGYLGADLPRRLGPAGADNEPGFWEPLDIVQTHEQLLAAAGSAWDDVSPLHPDWFTTADARRYEDQLLGLLESNYASSALFVLKDPRISRLIPLWIRVLERFGAPPSFVIAVRNPLEVAASLHARDGFSVQKSQLLWLRHMLEAERFSRGRPRSFVAYERLLSDWMAVTEQMAQELSLPWASHDHASQVEIERFLSAGLRHHTSSDEDLNASVRVLPSVKRLYGLLSAASGQPPAPVFPDNRLILDGMYRELGETDRAYGPLLAEARIVASEQLAQIEHDASQRVAQSERDASQRAAQSERDSGRALEGLRDQLTESARREAAYREQISALTAQVSGLSDEIEAQQRSLQDAGRQLEESQGDAQERQRRLQAALTETEQALVVSAGEVRALALRLSGLEQRLTEVQAELAQRQARFDDELAQRQAHFNDELAQRQAQFDRELGRLEEQAQESERTVSAKLAGRDQALQALEAQLSDSRQAAVDLRAQMQQLAGQVQRLEGERAETAAAAEVLQATIEQGAELEAQLRSELAGRAEALSASGERTAALSAEIARLQSDLLEVHDRLRARDRQLEDRQRESAAAEHRLAAELIEHDSELAVRDARVARLTAQIDALQRDLSLRTDELRSVGQELVLARTQLQARLAGRIHRSLQRLTAALGAQIGDVAAGTRRWWMIAGWLASKPTRPMARTYLAIRASGAFDTEFYLANYRDVARSGTDPLLHYIRYGVRDRYDPNAGFSTATYLSAHPELLKTGVNPLLHALQAGAPANPPALPAGQVVAAPRTEPPAEPVAEPMPETAPGQVAPDGLASAPPAQDGLASAPQAPEAQNEPVVVATPGSDNRTPDGSGSLTAIPRGAIVIFAGEEMEPRPSELSAHRVWPLAYRAADGRVDARGAQAEIEALRAKGAGYLVFTSGASAALRQAPELRDHLNAKYRCLVDRHELTLYELAGRRVRRRERRAHRTPGRGGLDVICMPIIDWNYRFQRPQQLMTQFARHGHRVFYLATTFQRDTKRPAITELAENVWGVRLAGRPEVNIYTEAVSTEVLDTVIGGLAALRQEARIGPAIMVVDLPFWGPIALESRDRWGWKLIYDCMDEHGGFVSAEEEGGDDLRKLIDLQERSLLAGSDLVLATGKLLHEKVSSISPNVVLVRNAADFEHFSHPGNRPPPTLPASLPRPVIGYYGAIASWFDASLIGYAAREHPEWSFVLAGRTTGADLGPIEGLPNVHCLGELSYAAVPGLLHQFDVACIPFHLIDLTLATNPVKFYEYMSAGKPVVSVELPELEPYRGYYYGFGSETEFVAQIERALAEDSPALRERRVALGQENTWAVRYDALTAAIKPWYRKAAVIITSFNNPEYLRQCLDSLRDKTDYPNFDVIVVDNGSDQSLIDEVAARSEHEQNLRLIAQGENVGFARANNIGIEAAADAEYVVMLNDDTVVTPGWLGRLIGHLQDDEIGLVGPVSNWAGNEARIDVPYSSDLAGLDEFALRRSEDRRGEVFDIAVLAMYCVAGRKLFIDQLGRLDERFRIGMFEDDDFAMRVREAGKRVVCAEDVFVHHWGRASFRRMSEAEYNSLFEANKRIYEEIWNRRWVPHRDRNR